MIKSAVFSLIALVASTLACPAQSSQNYPTRVITVLVPFAAGGPTDVVARLTAEEMSKILGQKLIVENAPGAGGTLASSRLAKADPDGYTLLVHHIGMSTAPSLYRKLPFDPRKAFAPIGLISDAPMTLISRADFPPNTLAEVITLAKSQPGKLSYGNSGLGAASHLCGMLFQHAIGVNVNTVGYNGNGPIMSDILGSHLDLTCDQTTNTTGPIRGKRVKAFVLTAPARLASLPDVPTFNEAGLKAFEISVWHGLYAPANTPPAIVEKLAAALQQALKNEALIEKFRGISTEPVSQERATPDALRKQLAAEIDRWGPIIKAAGQFAD